jgi:hypothetical protein
MEFNPCNRLNQLRKRSGVKIIPKTFSMRTWSVCEMEINAAIG